MREDAALERPEGAERRAELAELLDAAIAATSRVRPANTLVERSYDSTCSVRAGELQLEEALCNVLVTAAEALQRQQRMAGGPAQPRLGVRLFRDDAGLAVVEVTFGGAARQAPSPQEPVQSSGDGLALAREVIAILGGTLHVASRAEGSSTVTVRLPTS